MKYYVKELQLVENVQKTAGLKARDDVEKILSNNGFSEIIASAEASDRKGMGVVKTFQHHLSLKKVWDKTFEPLVENDIVVIQFPLINHTIFFNKNVKALRKKGVKVYLLIHDLESMRWMKLDSVPWKSKFRLGIEEISVLKEADGIISHNQSMTDVLVEKGISARKIENLEIFDYLIPDFEVKKDSDNHLKVMPIIVAGNLKPYKAGYLYNLPNHPNFNLYGIGFEHKEQGNIFYKGSFLSDDLPFVLEGGFGLIWDGPSIETCEGVHGDYLRVNNPHKTSLYLASGIPVIIWSQAALANFVEKNNCGFVIDTIHDIESKIEKMTTESYNELKKNAELVGSSLRNGSYTIEVLKKLRKKHELRFY
ncbi:galactofuranosyltransferase [Streptococcus sp. NLN76]|uniref:galactofuranosyltransferase n=1 Tax=Streptococcus sp. NLN76 TaxID=2822800 RepID=UPI0018ABFD90|nr:galactofuranosyltransferase [Streptococcus sp. NLN76]MBF8969891.1 galactofuranosyltransferase [Streptococcus sp. NLN76]